MILVKEEKIINEKWTKTTMLRTRGIPFGAERIKMRKKLKEKWHIYISCNNEEHILFHFWTEKSFCQTKLYIFSERKQRHKRRKEKKREVK